MSDYEGITLKEIFSIVFKNIYFIITFVILGLLVGLIVSGVQIMQNPVKYTYSAKSTLELTNSERMQSQDKTVLNLMTSSSILNAAKNELGISNGNYMVSTSSTTIPNHYDVIVTGPDEKQAIRLVDEIVSRGHSLATNSMYMPKNHIVQYGHAFGEPVVTSQSVNVTINIAVYVILAGMLSLLLIFVVHYTRGVVNSKTQVERAFNTKVLVTIPSETKESKYKKFFMVS